MVALRKPGAVLAGVALLSAGLLAGAPGAAASSHREAPSITEDPVADNTDVYAFVSPDRPDTVTLIANYIPLEEPAGGPNFHKFGDDVAYNINVDNNGDARPDLTYEFRFKTTIRDPNSFLYNTGQVTALNDPDLNVRQTYTLTEIRSGRRIPLAFNVPVPPVNIGPRSTPDYGALAAKAVIDVGNTGIRTFAGPRDEGFYVDLGSVFDLAGLRPLNQAHLIPLPPTKGEDGTSGYNVHSVALQIPISRLTAGDPVIGVYATAMRREQSTRSIFGGLTWARDWVQVSRLGSPLVNELEVPLGKKDRFNASQPKDDAQFAPFIRDPELGRRIPTLFPGVKVPKAPREDLAAVFLTGVPGLNKPKHVVESEQLRLNTSIPPSPKPNRLGVLAGDNAGYPNGRRPVDDVPDIQLRAVAGVLDPAFNVAPNNLLGDGVDGNDLPFLPNFPYLATPHQGYDHRHDHGTS